MRRFRSPPTASGISACSGAPSSGPEMPLVGQAADRRRTSDALRAWAVPERRCPRHAARPRRAGRSVVDGRSTPRRRSAGAMRRAATAGATAAVGGTKNSSGTRSSSGIRRRRISAQTSSPPRATTIVKCSPGNSAIGASSCCTAPNSSSAFCSSIGSSWDTMPLTLRASGRGSRGPPVRSARRRTACRRRASRARRRRRGRSPEAGTGTRLICSRGCTRRTQDTGCAQRQCRQQRPRPLGTPRRADLVDPDHLDQLVAARLIGRDDSLGPQVLQHPLVAVVGRADIGDARSARPRGPASVIAFSVTVRTPGSTPNRLIRSWRSTVANPTNSSLLMKL